MSTRTVKHPAEAWKVLSHMQHGAGLRAWRETVVAQHQVSLHCPMPEHPNGSVQRGTLDYLCRGGFVLARPSNSLADWVTYDLTDKGRAAVASVMIEDGQANWLEDSGWLASNPPQKRRRRSA